MGCVQGGVTVSSRFGHGVPRKRADVAPTRAVELRFGTVVAGKVTVEPQYGYGASRWTPIQLRRPYLNHDFICVQTGSTRAIYRGYVN
jgi:hypothetical protein